MIHLPQLWLFPSPTCDSREASESPDCGTKETPGQLQLICSSPFFVTSVVAFFSPRGGRRGQLIQHLISGSHNHFTCFENVQNMPVGGHFRGCGERNG